MKTVCAWCHMVLSDDNGKAPGLTSHGICEECAARVRREEIHSVTPAQRIVALEERMTRLEDTVEEQNALATHLDRARRHRDAYAALCDRAMLEHDQRVPSGRCDCTWCRQVAELAAAVQSTDAYCCRCLEPADGWHEGRRYCIACAAEVREEANTGGIRPAVQP